MWREFQKLGLQEGRWRGRGFYSGATVVVLGFVGQLLGSWPGGVPFFGFTACRELIPFIWITNGSFVTNAAPSSQSTSGSGTDDQKRGLYWNIAESSLLGPEENGFC